MRMKPKATSRSERSSVGLRLSFISSPASMFLDEEVVRFVLVECADDVVAIAPGGGAFAVDGESFGLGESDQVEASGAPNALSVSGVGQEFVDDFS